LDLERLSEDDKGIAIEPKEIALKRYSKCSKERPSRSNTRV
jgi:hypothetical protein